MPFDIDVATREPPPSPASTTPLDAFPAFVEVLRRRLDAGRAYEATRPAVERPTADLIAEIQEELADVCGWTVALWARLERLKATARCLDEDVENAVRAERGGW